MRLSSLACAIVLAACTTREARPPVVPVTPVAPAQDPRVAVTEWSQVQRFHCARGPDGAPGHCVRDADCAQGAVCDTSGGCGCCVPPPARLEANATLHRSMF